MNNKVMLIAILTLLMFYPCNASHAQSPIGPSVAKGILHYIADGIQHFRLSTPEASLKISLVGNGLARLTGEPVPISVADSPDDTDADAYWISNGSDLSFDVHFEHNLNADRGDKIWYCVEKRLVCYNGQISTLNLFRMRTPLQDSLFSEIHSWGGSTDVANAFVDGLWCEHANLDPRYFMYYVDGMPLDELINNIAYNAKVTGKAELYGCNCTAVELKKSLPDGSTYIIDCFIDIDHDFIVRKTKILLVPAHSTDNN